MKHYRLVVMTASLVVLLVVRAPAHGIVVAESEPALAGIGESLPPLSEAARQALTVRAEAGDLDAMYALAHHALLDSDDPMGRVPYFGEDGTSRAKPNGGGSKRRCWAIPRR